MTDSSSPSPTPSVANSVIGSVNSDEESAEAPKIDESANKSSDVEEEEKPKEDDDDDEEKPSSKEEETTKKPSKALPAIITDEEGFSIPEASKGDGSNIYQYRDFSNVPEEELEQQPLAAPPPPSSRGAVEASIRVQKFPVKLYAILAQKEFSDIVCWMPHGRSWKVLKPNLFESLVMPLFFEYSNYHSFNRLVNAWSFRRISSGPDRGSYYHELFLRGKPYLQKYMRRLPKTHKKLPMKKENEPDFYAMDKANPLPAVDEAPLPPGIPAGDASMMRGGLGAARGGGALSPMRGMSGEAMMPAHREMMMMRGAGGMSPMRGAAAQEMMGGAYKDPLLSRGGMSGMMGGMSGMSSMGGMSGGMMGGGMSGMGMGGMSSPMGGMSGMSGMPGMMGGMDSMGGMMPGGMSSMGGMSGMSGMGMSGMGMSGMSPMSSFRESQAAAGDMEFQRLRQIQQMHMLDRQVGGGPMSMPTSDAYDRMRNMEMRLGR